MVENNGCFVYKKDTQLWILSQPDSGLKSESSESINLIEKLNLFVASKSNPATGGPTIEDALKTIIKPMAWDIFSNPNEFTWNTCTFYGA